MKLQGRTAIVTGAARGIGRGLAAALAAEGARVIVNDVNDPQNAANAISAAGGNAYPVQADIATARGRELLFATAADVFGPVDIMVNNAGLDPGVQDFLEMDEAGFDVVLSINLKGTYFCSQLAARQMVAQGRGGRIINISSIHADVTVVGRAAYAASKGAINALTRSLALSLAPHRITVNAIAPGYIEVERNIAYYANYSSAEWGEKIPVGRVGFPADVAALAVYMASPEADFLTGQVISCDGGTTALMALGHSLPKT